MLVDLFTRSH